MSARPSWLAASIMIMLAGCATTQRPSTKTASAIAARATEATAASCAALTPAQQLKAAAVAFAGTMLPGPTTTIEHRHVLLSPARMRVNLYIKGSGPKIVRVRTGAVRTGRSLAVSEDGIQPRPGQTWTILTHDKHQPYSTSLCAGSTPS